MEVVVRFILGVACFFAAQIAMVHKGIRISNWEWWIITFGIMDGAELILE